MNVKRMWQMMSIQTKLTLSYTFGFFVLLSLIVIIVYLITLNVLYKADYQFLIDEVDTIHYILRNSPLDLKELKEAIVTTPLNTQESIYHYYTRVYDSKQNVIMQTPGMDNILYANQYIKRKKITEHRFYWFNQNDKHYLLIHAPIKIGAMRKPGLIEIVLDITQQHVIMNDKPKFIWLIIIGTLCSLLLGFMIARRGMRHLFSLTKTVEEITAVSLNKRIDPKFWPQELRSLGLAFNQMLDRIENSFVRLKQFSADLAHELRTPITNLTGATEVALSYSENIKDYQLTMESNLEELQRMSLMIENMLFLARSENPQLHIEKKEINIKHVIQLMIEFYQAIADEKNIKIHLSGDDIFLSVNYEMFRRLISNLLSNALQYTDNDGQIYFIIKDMKNAVRIECRDTGIGIAKEHLPKIFDRFYRVDPARSHNHMGVGLGLAIAKSIVEVHHGVIILQSEVQQGTSICITLPR